MLAGHEILKTVHIVDTKVTEEVNLRAAVTAYNSAHSSGRQHFLPATEVKWSHGVYGNLIATAAVNGPIVVYDVNKTTELSSLHEHRGQVHRLAFDPHIGRYLLSGSQDGTVKFWDLRAAGQGKATTVIKCAKRYSGRSGPVRDVRWSPTKDPTDAIEFATASDNGVIQKWDMRNPEYPLLRINAHEKSCSSIDWHPDGRHVVSAGFDRYVRVWDFSNPNKRQKEVFRFRAPHAVTNVRWRPPCWSSELAETGQWQSTQLITSYTRDDPRLHLWDLRRPLLPFRELDRYNSPATDFLWASKDLLWTVGNEGVFTQTDINFTTQVHKQIPPTALSWANDGEYVAFVEDRTHRRESGLEDAAAGFLSMPQQKLSSGDDAVVSRSLTDDEAPFEGMETPSAKHRQTKSVSARSVKSQASTPPGNDGIPHVLPFDRAVLDRKDLFQNNQIGLSSVVPGATIDLEDAKYLAHTYSQPIVEQGQKPAAEQVLQRLEKAFKANGDACDAVSMHRTAQSWRILGAVIVPELRDWAERNRKRRLKQQDTLKEQSIASAGSLKSSEPKEKTQIFGPTTQHPIRKPVNAVLQGIRESTKKDALMEPESTSNIATPLAQPLPDSPSSDPTANRSRFLGLDESIENLPPLPPSVAAAHSAAAAASKALQDATSETSMSPGSSPQKGRRPQREDSGIDSSPISSPSHRISPPLTRAVPQSINPPSSTRRQEDRRAALRDYKVQARPLLNFDQPVDGDSQSAAGSRGRVSNGSFPLFPASTDSSDKLRGSLEASSSSPSSRAKGSATSDGWRIAQGSDSFEQSSPMKSDEYRRLHLDDAISSQLEGNVNSPHAKVPHQSDGRDFGPTASRESSQLQSQDSIATSPDMPFHFETDESRQHVSRANDRLPAAKSPAAADMQSSIATIVQNKDEDLRSQAFIWQDFCPIPTTDYSSKVPFAWSARPLIAHSIAFDLSLGAICGQFSASLLMLIYQFFFFASETSQDDNKTAPFKPNLIDRLADPRTAHRIMEGIFQTYAEYLRNMKWSVPLTELRNFCRQAGFASFQPSANLPDDVSPLTGNDPQLIHASCQECKAAWTTGTFACGRCGNPAEKCPICHSWHLPPPPAAQVSEATPSWPTHSGRTWTFCPSCGHGTHTSCTALWLSQPETEGLCPTSGCSCDCGPGAVRKARVEKQTAEDEESKLIRGSGSAAVLSQSPRGSESRNVTPSAAVQKARLSLRGADWDERATQSGDERGGVFGRRRGAGSGGSGVSGLGADGGERVGHGQSSQGQSRERSSMRKSVRLVMPGES